MSSIHPDHVRPRLKPIRDPLHRLKLGLNDVRSRVDPPDGPPRFCVGLAKAGTHTLAEMMAGSLRSAHEPEPAELLAALPRARAGRIAASEMRELFRARRRRLRLDLESSHLLGSFVVHLLDTFDDARFVLLVREPRDWINSMINDQLYVRATPSYPMWRVVYEQYLGGEGGRFPAAERSLAELDLHPLRHYVSFWTEEITAIMDAVPGDRLLVVPTARLSDEAATIARFLGAEGVPAVPHSYRASGRRDVVSELDPDHVARTLAPTEPVLRRVAAHAAARGARPG